MSHALQMEIYLSLYFLTHIFEVQLIKQSLLSTEEHIHLDCTLIDIQILPVNNINMIL